jgi:hypothetical protein
MAYKKDNSGIERQEKDVRLPCRFSADAWYERTHYRRGQVYNLTEREFINLKHSCMREAK